MIFAAVGDKMNINKYLSCLQKAGFKVIAVEKPALGVLRFIRHFAVSEDQYLVIDIDRDGIDLIVSQNNNLIFYDFNSLGEIAKYDLDNNLSTQDFLIYLNKKVGQVVNFCQARQNACLKKFFLFSIIPDIKNEMINSLTTNLGLELITLKNEKIVKIPEE
jgi:Tfp pilus assembly PilM family ATPase